MLKRIKRAYYSACDRYARYQRAQELRRTMLVSDKNLREEYIKLDADLKGKSGSTAHALVAEFLWGGERYVGRDDILSESIRKVRPYGDKLASRSFAKEVSPERALALGKAPESTEKRGPREYVFNEPDGHTPLPPQSALYRPPRLSYEEKAAVEFVEGLKKHSKFIDNLDVFASVKLKPALKKKHAEVTKGPRRVVFDDKGKMKEVKGA